MLLEFQNTHLQDTKERIRSTKSNNDGFEYQQLRALTSISVDRAGLD